MLSSKVLARSLLIGQLFFLVYFLLAKWTPLKEKSITGVFEGLRLWPMTC